MACVYTRFRLKAEIQWALDRIMCHVSSRACEKSVDLFPFMFPDSSIAKSFTMGKDEAAYVITFGLGPYYEDELQKKIEKSSFYAISIDESLNKIAGKAQMDVIIRYWDNESNKLETKYVTSLFPEKCDAKTLLSTLKHSLPLFGVKFSNIIQLSLDGPNVNLKLFKIFNDFLNEFPGASKLVDVGTCNVHIVHGAYKTGHKKVKWQIFKFLRAIYFLFKDFPKRRGDFQRINGTSSDNVFPMKFCAIRWLENGPVLKRAIKILPLIRKYVKEVEDPPNSDNFETIKKILQTDKFLEPKLHFMLSIVELCQPFLLKYQSDAPLLPFLYADLQTLTHTIGAKFLTKVLFTEKIDSKYLKTEAKVDVGVGAANILQKNELSDILSFKSECRDYLKEMFVKLIARCSLKNNIVKGASAFSPQVMLNERKREERLSLLLSEMSTSGTIVEFDEAERIKIEYLQLCSDTAVQEYLKTFNRFSNHRLDDYLLNITEFYHISDELQKFMKTIFVFFASNAAVERPFSINKHCLAENMVEKSLIAQRIVYDNVKNEDLTKFEIDNAMMQYFKMASNNRNKFLKRKNTENDEEDVEEKKRKARELHTLELKKQKLEESLEQVNATINYFQKK